MTCWTQNAVFLFGGAGGKAFLDYDSSVKITLSSLNLYLIKNVVQNFKITDQIPLYNFGKIDLLS